jgi:hypothetical protein
MTALISLIPGKTRGHRPRLTEKNRPRTVSLCRTPSARPGGLNEYLPFEGQITMNLGLAGKVVFIGGGSNGIGLASRSVENLDRAAGV